MWNIHLHDFGLNMFIFQGVFVFHSASEVNNYKVGKYQLSTGF